MGGKHSRASIISIAVLFALIIANVVLSMPPRSALSDTKPAQKETARARPAEDFGAETIEPQKNQRYSSSEAKPIPADLAEEPLKTAVPAVPEGQTANQVHKGGDDDSDNESEAGAENDNDEANAAVTTSLNGNEIDIAALVKTFSKMTKRNYVVDNTVKGKVAIHLATPVSVPEALRIFESVLLLKGFTTVPLGNNTWKVITAKDAKQTTIPMLGDASDKSSDALVTQLIRLKNTQASELQQVLSQFVSKEGMINAFGATNALILIDSAANIKRLMKLVDELDVPAVDQDITIVPVVHAEAKDIADKINSILGSEKDKSGQDQNGIRTNLPTVIARPGLPQPVQPSSGVTTAGERRQLPLRLIPDERTNSLIVVADKLLTDKVRALAEQLDSLVDRSGGKFYVYRLQHADADEMSQILQSVVTGTSTGSTSSKKSSSKSGSSTYGSSSSSSSSGFGGERNSLADAQTANRDRITQALRQQNPTLFAGGNRTGEGGTGKVNLEGDVSIAADTSTNSLVINASHGDYQKIKELIDLLDVKRRQVLVEATILEVSLTKDEGMGVEFQTTAGTDQGGAIAQTNFGGITNLLTNPAALSDLTIAAASSGSIVLPGGLTLPSQAVLVTALSRNQNVNVLSAPTVLAIDNQEAEIKVGENVPFVTSTSTNQTNLNNTFNQIERQDVGIKLRITPQISAGDFVVLKIYVEISDVVAGTQNLSNGPTTNIRTTDTMVEVKSNQMVVTGGLIKDQVTNLDRGIPYLQDIPVLGALFRHDEDTRNRTNLLVFITPRIITDQFVARDQTLEKRDSLAHVIDEQQAEPDRAEYLNSPDMNRVIESQPLGDTPPTTVLPPKATRAAAPSGDSTELLATKRTEQRLSQIMGGGGNTNKPVDNSPVGDTPGKKATFGDDEELELNVAPELPGDRPAQHSSVQQDMPAAATTRAPVSNAAGSDHTFVVLREVSHVGKKKTGSPFQYADSEKTLGLSLAVAGSSPKSRFFEAGERYTYQSGNGRMQFVCLGKYASIGEAKILHPALGTAKKWYTLSTDQSLEPEKAGWRAG